MSDIYFTVKAIGAILEAVFCGAGVLIAGAVAVASVNKREARAWAFLTA